MAIPTISPILADLSQDIAGAIPLELILLWNTSDKTGKKHLDLLAPYVRKGTVVSSDSAGLSKLSATRELLDVMQLVSQPKEVVYAFGAALGGKGIGLWVADNTQMFYDEHIEPQDIIESMICAQLEIKSLTVQIGLGVHCGTFLEIGGGLYGEDADFVEELAENNTEGGQIAITHTVSNKISREYLQYISNHPEYPNSFLLDYTNVHPVAKKHLLSQYPYPFDVDFFKFLKSYESLSAVQRAKKVSSFAQHKVVVLIKVLHKKQKHLLEQLTNFIVANAYMNQVLKDFPDVTLVKSNGNLGIFVVNDVKHSIEFAKKLHQKLDQNDFIVNVGLSQGEVLLFPLQNGFEIAGGPVNIASKLAEDSGVKGKILAESSVEVNEPQAQPFSFMISHVEIKGKYI